MHSVPLFCSLVWMHFCGGFTAEAVSAESKDLQSVQQIFEAVARLSFFCSVASVAKCQHFPGQYVFVRSFGFSSRKFGPENRLCVYRSTVEAAEVTI